ncbi:hypothetical protein LFYK43_07220 [Ligilactobacillus salitolerans]|uniref:Alcohol dehydrogenase-like N-terminal domain-containing protein n=1 Tax=Ligilactobacillus salitolerans TaxID=1808352 RepID=A0A401IRU9_9LACO|nr:hypothetical protein LFYK43_07220 [Ligilactobacillus salitolerans]
MKAAQLEKYAKDFTLQVNEIPVPEIGANDVLVKVKTAAVNPVDSLIGTGSLKLIQNYKFPLTMGNELTGIIEKRGSKVTDIQLGEAVYTRLPVQKLERLQNM